MTLARLDNGNVGNDFERMAKWVLAREDSDKGEQSDKDTRRIFEERNWMIGRASPAAMSALTLSAWPEMSAATLATTGM